MGKRQKEEEQGWAAALLKTKTDNKNMMQNNEQVHYLLFQNGAPLGITNSKETLNAQLQERPKAIYCDYSSYAQAYTDISAWFERNAMPFHFDDGGRSDAGYQGYTGDCVARSIAIATGTPYQEVYDGINRLAKHERTGKRKRGKSNARDGVYRTTESRYMKQLGWKWVPTMAIGTGCKVHLRKGELPEGRLVVSVSKHTTAVIDGEIHDIHDCGRGGRRCVYGYYIKQA